MNADDPNASGHDDERLNEEINQQVQHPQFGKNGMGVPLTPFRSNQMAEAIGSAFKQK